MSRPALVTGASGGLGLALVEALTRARRPVIALGRREARAPRLLATGVTYLRGDLADRTVAATLMPRDVGTVFHCAALSAHWGRPADFRRANVEATRNLLEAAAARGAEAFVHVSTPSIYAALRDREGITEADAPADPPLNDYARTKLEAERMVLASDALRTVAIRPRAIVGPDDTVVLPRLVALARGGRIPLFNGGRARVEFTDVRDVVSALLAAEARIDRARGQAFNISGGRPVEVRTVARRLAEVLGLRARTVAVPMPVARAIAGGVEALWPRGRWAGEPRLTRYALATLAYGQTFDLTAAERVLGWRPAHDGFATLLARAEAMR